MNATWAQYSEIDPASKYWVILRVYI